jgi:hypothetical protein
LDGWSKKHEFFYRPEFNKLSGHRRVLDASGGGFLCVFSHNRAAKKRFFLKVYSF